MVDRTVLTRRGMLILAAGLAVAAGCDRAPDRLTIDAPWTRATPGPIRVGGVFLVLRGGPEDDRLIGAESARSDRVELHAHVRQGDSVMMQKVEDGLAIAAGDTVRLAPGGYHLMVFGLDGPLVAGETLPMTLVFEKAGRVDIAVPVQPVDYQPPR